MIHFHLISVTFVTLLISFNLYAGSRVLYFTDSEGHDGSIQNMVKHGYLTINEAGDQIDFTNRNDILVFGGDLAGREVSSRKLVHMMNDLSTRERGRVFSINGNHDTNRSAILRNIQLFDRSTGDVSTWLNYVMSEMGLGSHLKNDQVEMEKLISDQLGREVKLSPKEEAFCFLRFIAPKGLAHKFYLNSGFQESDAEQWIKDNIVGTSTWDYFKFLAKTSSEPNPSDAKVIDFMMYGGGEFWEFVKNTRFMHSNIENSAAFTHLGLNTENMGIDVEGTLHDNFIRQAKSLEEFHQNEFNRMETQIRTNQKIESNYIIYGDAAWSPNTGIRPIARSTVYSFRLRDAENPNLRLPPAEVINFLTQKADGFSGKIEVVGHTPVVIPIPLRGVGFIKIHADTSFHPLKRESFLVIENERIKSVGYSSTGTPITFDISPNEDSPIGKLWNGYHIAGFDPKGNYFGFKYTSGHDFEEISIPKDALFPQDLDLPYTIFNSEINENYEALIKFIDEKTEINRLGDREMLDRVNDRFVLNVYGSSTFNEKTVDNEYVVELFEAVFSQLKTHKIYLGTGGTNVGIEKIAHEVAAKYNIEVVSYIGVNAKDEDIAVDQIKYATVVPGNGWADAIKHSISTVATDNSLTLYIGGGGTVEKCIETSSRRLGHHFLLNSKIVGKAKNAAELMNHKAFSTPQEVIAEIDRINPNVLRESSSMITSLIQQSKISQVKTELLESLDQYEAGVFIAGFGQRAQFADMNEVLFKVENMVKVLNNTYGEGKWYAVFGGDNYHEDKPDVSHIIKFLKERHQIPIVGVTLDETLKWGGMDEWVDHKVYLPTEFGFRLNPDGTKIIEPITGTANVRPLWGGFRNGKPVGATAFYLTSELINEAFFFGTGTVGAQEYSYAKSIGIPSNYFRSRAKNPDEYGEFGMIPAEISGALACKKLFN